MWGAILIASTLTFTFASVARAQSPVDLQWSAPTECGGRQDVERGMQRWLEDRGPMTPETRVVVRAHVELVEDAHVYALRLELESEGGSSRQLLHANSCKALVDLVALKTALLLAPLEVSERVQPVPAPAPQPEPAQATVPPPTPTPTETSGPEVGLGARAEGDVSLGLWPEPAFGLGAAGIVTVGAFRLEGGVRHAFGRSLRYETAPATGAEVSLTAGMFRGCASPRLGAVELPLCVGLDAGRMRGRGEGVEDARTSRKPWVGLSIGAGLAVPIVGPLWLAARAEGVAQLVRVRYRVQNLPELYASDRTALRVTLGAELRFQVTD